MTAADSAERAPQYDPRAIQEKWQARWAEMDLFRASDDPDDDRPRTYMLDMFPYPSGDLHMGHAEAYAIGDAMARYFFQRGHNVLHPIGWDAFGLPAENAAIRNNTHPADWTYAEHRDPGRLVPAVRGLLRLVAPAADLRPGLLPLEPVAVPALLRARPGLPQGRLRQLVPGRPDRAGQRAGHRRAGASAAAPRSSAGC